MKKLVMIATLSCAVSAMAAPIISYDFSTDGSVTGGVVGNASDWTAVNKVTSWIGDEGAIASYRGARYTAQSLNFSTDNGFRIEANITVTPITTQNDVGSLFQFVSYQTTKDTSGSIAYGAASVTDLGLQITTAGGSGIALRSSDDGGNQYLKTFAELGITVDGVSGAITDDPKVAANITATYEIIKTATLNEYSIKMWMDDDEANASQYLQTFAGTDGEDLWFQNYSQYTDSKTINATMNSFSVEPIVAIPEPATLGLFGLGALGAVLIRRIRK